MPTFSDQENFEIIPECDCIFTVTGFEQGSSKGAKTKDCTQYTVKLDLHDERGNRMGAISDTLIEHASTAFRLDTFLKSTDAVRQFGIRKGQDYEFVQPRAESRGVPWVNPIGLRGWCKVIVDKWTKTDPKTGRAEERERNKVGIYYTDRPKLEPVAENAEEF